MTKLLFKAGGFIRAKQCSVADGYHLINKPPNIRTSTRSIISPITFPKADIIFNINNNKIINNIVPAIFFILFINYKLRYYLSTGKSGGPVSINED